ncbi:MAG: DUF3299 domain-containing protein [Maricaulaceae bacterium]
MKRLSLVLALLLSAPALAEPPRTVYWEDLMPEGELDALQQQYDDFYASVEQQLLDQAPQSLFDFGGQGGPGGVLEGSALDTMPQLGTFNVVDELDGERVRIPGFVLPFEYSASGEVSEFLLVPYFGACIHTPPPPPNQIVHVTADDPVKLGSQYDAVWITGVLSAQRNINELGDAAYTLDIESWESYDG